MRCWSAVLTAVFPSSTGSVLSCPAPKLSIAAMMFSMLHLDDKPKLLTVKVTRSLKGVAPAGATMARAAKSACFTHAPFQPYFVQVWRRAELDLAEAFDFACSISEGAQGVGDSEGGIGMDVDTVDWSAAQALKVRFGQMVPLLERWHYEQGPSETHPQKRHSLGPCRPSRR